MVVVVVMMMVDGCDDNDDGQVCGQHHLVLCVILGEHLLALADLLPRWSILSCRQ